jgi:hypothetical protein
MIIAQEFLKSCNFNNINVRGFDLVGAPSTADCTPWCDIAAECSCDIASSSPWMRHCRNSLAPGYMARP